MCCWLLSMMVMFHPESFLERVLARIVPPVPAPRITILFIPPLFKKILGFINQRAQMALLYVTELMKIWAGRFEKTVRRAQNPANGD